ncbi:hypothetical protein ABTK21_20005, partial [Acinetobacter baumannii]
AAAIDAANSSSRLLLMALGAVMVGVGCVTAWNITKGITAPLVAANGLAERVAEGNLVPSGQGMAARSDEIGQLQMTLRRMRE